MKEGIRKFEDKDIEIVYNLGIQIPEFSVNDETSHRFWPKDTLERFVEQGLSLVIEDQNSVVGFLLAVYQPVTLKLTWENMYIIPEYRKKGIAGECFQKGWKLAQQHGATAVEALVKTNNTPSQQMLKRLNFNNAGNYYWMLKFKED